MVELRAQEKWHFFELGIVAGNNQNTIVFSDNYPFKSNHEW